MEEGFPDSKAESLGAAGGRGAGQKKTHFQANRGEVGPGAAGFRYMSPLRRNLRRS